MLLAALVAAGAVSMAAVVYQAQPPQGPPVVEVEKLKDNLYLLKGGGGNTAAFITANGVVVVDTKNPGWGQPILDKIKTFTDKPVTMIINTHTHGDHTSGNVEFPATVDIVVQENTKTNMEKMDIFKQNSGKGMPKKTFKDKMTLLGGDDRIDLYYFGPGHTSGDAWVVFPTLRMMHAGDMFAGKSAPFIDASNGGSGIAYSQTLSNAVAGVKDVDSVITGHSTVMTWNDLKEFTDFNKDFLAWVQSEMKAGKSVDDAAAEYKVPEKYKDFTTGTRVKNDIEIIYSEAKGK
jgi:glyoxylase-like metal-dependent hydrolase (beta-lactamase superfamily II)